MASEKKPSIYSERSAIGSSEELDEYGVWVKSEPQDMGSLGADIPETEVTLDFTIDLGGDEPAGDLSISDSELPEIPGLDTDDITGFEDLSFPEDESSVDYSAADDLSAEIETVELGESLDIESEADDEPQGVSQTVSTEILMNISDELTSIRNELALLKKEFASFRSETAEHGGFFAEEEDEKIALTGDEMNNFINTASLSVDTVTEQDDDVLEELSSVPDISFEEAEIEIEPVTAAEEDIPEEAVEVEEEIKIDLDDLGIELDEIGAAAGEEAPADEAVEIKIEDYDVFAGDEAEGIIADDPAIGAVEDFEIELEEAVPEDIEIAVEETADEEAPADEAVEIKIEDYDILAGDEAEEITLDDPAIEAVEDFEIELEEAVPEDIEIAVEETVDEEVPADEAVEIKIEDYDVFAGDEAEEITLDASTEEDIPLAVTDDDTPQELDVSLDVDMDLSPIEDDDELQQLRVEGVQPLTPAPEDTSYLEEEPVAEVETPEPEEISFDESALDISLDETAFDLDTTEEYFDSGSIDLSQAVIEEPDLSVGIVENPVEEPLLEDISVDEDFSIELETTEELEMPPDVSVEEEIPLADEPEEAVEAEGTIDLDDAIQLEDIVDLEDTEEPVESLEIESLNLDISLDDRDNSLAQIIPEGFEVGAEEAPAPFDDDIEPFVEEDLAADTLMESTPIEDFATETVTEEKASGLKNLDIPVGLKNELKKILSYMDELLESLPEEKIDEFARSEYFDSYKKLFKELGLV